MTRTFTGFGETLRDVVDELSHARRVPRVGEPFVLPPGGRRELLPRNVRKRCGKLAFELGLRCCPLVHSTGVPTTRRQSRALGSTAVAVSSTRVLRCRTCTRQGRCVIAR